MHHRPHRNQFLHRINIFIAQAKLAHERQLAIDQSFAQMAQIEMHHRPVRPIYRAAFLHFSDVCLRQPVARPQFHGFLLRMLGVVDVERLAEVVVLQITVAVLVDQDAALAAGRLGDQDAGAGQSRRMILDELHILQRRARAISQGHAVASLDGGVGSERENAAAAAGT